MKDDQKVSISVIVPVYNVELYLRDCLNSLVSQTSSFFEIILVNDGSTDHSRKICEEYCSQNGNMILIDQDNQGLSAARNSGLRYASGDYIVFVDSDDYVTSHMNENLVLNLTENSVDILYYNADVINETGGEYSEELVRSDFLNGHIMSGIEFLERCFPDNYRTSACLEAYRKSFLDKYKLIFPYGLYYEDNLFFMQTALRAQRIFCIPNCFYIRRIRSGSIMTESMSSRKCLDHIAMNMLIWRELYTYEDKHKYQQFYKKYISVRLIYTFLFLRGFESDTAVSQSLAMMMKFFMEKWVPIYNLDSLNWDEVCALCVVANCLSCIEGKDNADHQLELARLNRAIDKMLVDKLSMLPLMDVGRKVGIYGIGKHTDILLRMYRCYIGEIHCELFFIVTDKKQDIYMGKQVVSCNEVPGDADIIISSRIFEEAMLETLLANRIRKEKIISIYDSDSSSKGNLVMLAEVYKEHWKKED